VRRAARQFGSNAPRHRGRCRALRRWRARRVGEDRDRAGRRRTLRRRVRGDLLPVRHQPGEDRLRRAELRQARARDQQPDPEASDPLQQVQQFAQLPSRRGRGLEGAGEELRLRVGAGRR
jgi:hypothetical protein